MHQSYKHWLYNLIWLGSIARARPYNLDIFIEWILQSNQIIKPWSTTVLIKRTWEKITTKELNRSGLKCRRLSYFNDQESGHIRKGEWKYFLRFIYNGHMEVLPHDLNPSSYEWTGKRLAIWQCIHLIVSEEQRQMKS